jgi:hypothetical protein
MTDKPMTTEDAAFLRCLADDHREITKRGLPPAWLSLHNFGIRRSNLRGLSGYELAFALRKGADSIESLARHIEEMEDAHLAVFGTRDGTKGGDQS